MSKLPRETPHLEPDLLVNVRCQQVLPGIKPEALLVLSDILYYFFMEF